MDKFCYFFSTVSESSNEKVKRQLLMQNDVNKTLQSLNQTSMSCLTALTIYFLSWKSSLFLKIRVCLALFYFSYTFISSFTFCSKESTVDLSLAFSALVDLWSSFNCFLVLKYFSASCLCLWSCFLSYFLNLSMISLSLTKVSSYFSLTVLRRSPSFLFCSLRRQISFSWFVLISLICLFKSSSLEGLYLIFESLAPFFPLLSTELFSLKILNWPFLTFLLAAWILS